MFDFNNVIEDNNSKETTDKVFLSMLDIRVLFFNKYKYLIEVKNPSEDKGFQKITNIIDNTYGNKNNKCPFIMEKQFHLLLEKYFKVIDTKQLYPGYKEYEPYFTNNSKRTEQIIYTDGIFMIEETSEGSLTIFSPDHDYSIKLASYNDKLIEQITDLSYPSNYNKIVRDITEECLINSFLTHENLSKIFKLLYNVDIKISEDPIYLIGDYNYDKPIYKIINVNGDLLSKVLSVKKYNFKCTERHEACEFTNNYFKITYTYKSNTFDDFIKCIAFNKKDFDYMTLKSILQKL